MQYTNCHLVGSSLVGVMCDAFRNESAKQDVETPTWTNAPVHPLLSVRFSAAIFKMAKFKCSPPKIILQSTLTMHFEIVTLYIKLLLS